MNPPLEAPSNQAETAGLRHDDVEVAKKARRISLHQGDSVLRWLEATVRTIDFRRDELERTHWKKVWRSMVVD